jgi:threonine aldolase
VLPLAYLEDARAVADAHGLGLHLDGARVFNASVALGVPAATISRHFDSISVDHLQRDHANAERLADALRGLCEFDIGEDAVRTNMVFVPLRRGALPDVVEGMRQQGVLVYGSKDTLRLVTHFDFSEKQIKMVAEAFQRVLG